MIGDYCGLCMSGGPEFITRCGHLFHENCIKNGGKVAFNCPACHTGITPSKTIEKWFAVGLMNMNCFNLGELMEIVQFLIYNPNLPWMHVFDKLLQMGYEINLVFYEHFTLIFQSYQAGRFDMVECLAIKGADVNKTYENGKTLIHYAFEAGNFALIKVLINYGGNIHALDRDMKSIFHYAITKGTPESILKLLNEFKFDLRQFNEAENLKFIVTLESRGFIEVARILNDKISSIFPIDRTNEIFPLVVETLLNIDFNVIYDDAHLLLSDSGNNTILHRLVLEPKFINMSKTKRTKILDFLKSKKFNFSKANKDGLSAAQWAFKVGFIDLSNHLKEYETSDLISNMKPFPIPADSNVKDPLKTLEEAENRFIEACKDKKIRYYSTITGLKKFFPDELYFYKRYVLYAFRYNHLEMAKELIEMNEEAENVHMVDAMKRKTMYFKKYKDADGITCFHLACVNDNAKLIDLISAYEFADVHSKTIGIEMTPVHVACLFENTKILDKLDRLCLGARMMTNDFASIMHFCCLYSSVKMAKKIDDCVSFCSCRDSDGAYPLHYIAMNPDPKVLNFFSNYNVPAVAARTQKDKIAMAKYMLQGSKHVLYDKDYNTLLSNALLNGNMELFNFVMKNHVENVNEHYLLHAVARYDKIELFETVMKLKVDVNEQNPDGVTSLMLACYKGNAEMIKKLIQSGANVNLKDEKGRSAIHYAAFDDQIRIDDVHQIDSDIYHQSAEKKRPRETEKSPKFIKLLVEAGVEVDCRDILGRNALHHAVNNGHSVSFIKEFVTFGVDPKAVDLSGKSVLDYSTNEEVTQYLKGY